MRDFLTWLFTAEHALPVFVGGLGLFTLGSIWLLASIVGRRRDLVLAVDDPTEPPEPDWHEEATDPVLVVDPPIVPAYVFCGLEWADDGATPSQHAPRDHICALVGGHRFHRCGACTAELDSQPQRWVTFGGHRVHQECMDARRDGQPITDGCAPHLVGAAGNLPAGGTS